MRDYYVTVASVLPILLLALMFDSGYLERLRHAPRRLRRNDLVGGVRFWTKPRVRADLCRPHHTVQIPAQSRPRSLADNLD